MSIAAYLRVSTYSQNAAGQEQTITRWLRGNGIDEDSVLWIVDHDTGDSLDRPGFDELQRLIFLGKIKTVLVFKLDRISRTVHDGLNTLCGWCKQGVRLVSVSQLIDFNGTPGKLIASVLFAVAEMEQETRRERQAAGIAVAKQRGVYRGRKPGTTKARPERARQLRARGYTVKEVATALGVSKRTAIRYLA